VTFLWLGLLVLLAIVPALVALYAWSQRRRRLPGARYSSLSLIRAAMPGSSRVRRHLPFALFAAGVAALVMALGRPAMVLSVPANPGPSPAPRRRPRRARTGGGGGPATSPASRRE